MSDPAPPEALCSTCRASRPVLSTSGDCIDCAGAAMSVHARSERLLAHVREHPGITVGEAARLLGISPSRIAALIEKGRLQLARDASSEHRASGRGDALS